MQVQIIPPYICRTKTKDLVAQKDKKELAKIDFEVTKKNFKKVLADWKKFFTFALANQEQDDRLRILRKRKEQSSLTIRYNNQVRKKTKASILN